MTQQQVDNRVKILQYLNTGILTLILGLAGMISVQLRTINQDATTAKVERTILKGNDDLIEGKLNNLETRIDKLETFNIDLIKDWVDANYVRKPQR